MIAILLALLAAPATPELAPVVLYDARIPTLTIASTERRLFLNAVLLGPAY